MFQTMEQLGVKQSFGILSIPAGWISPCRTEVKHMPKGEIVNKKYTFLFSFSNGGNDWE